MRVEKGCEERRSASREEERVGKSVSRDGVRVEKECKLSRSETREGVRVEKEGE